MSPNSRTPGVRGRVAPSMRAIFPREASCSRFTVFATTVRGGGTDEVPPKLSSDAPA
jgi:hypothetical protein